MLARRRSLAALCVGAAVLAGLRATAPVAPPTVQVPVLTRDVAAGAVLGAGDVAMVGFAPEAVPDGVVAAPQGRMVAGPVARGEPVTATRLLGPGLLDALGTGPGSRSSTGAAADLTAMPVRFPDSAMAGLLRVGDAIDVLAIDPQGGEPRRVGAGARVLALPRAPSDTASDGLPGRLVVLGVEAAAVPGVADASVRLFLTFAYEQ